VISAGLPTTPPRFASLAAIETSWSSWDQHKLTSLKVVALEKVLARFGL
jgi:hypothetical protein